MGDVAGVQDAGLIKTSSEILMRKVRINSPMLSAVLLAIGTLFCVLSASGFTKTLCVTEGCQIYQNYNLFGLSLHIWGAAAFALGLLLLAYRPALYPRFIATCLWGEILLITYQVIYLPCSECLLVGLIWGLLAVLQIRERLSVKIWSVVFLIALVMLSKDLLHPWALYGPGDAQVKVYFSPSCKACRTEIEQLLAGKDAAREKVAFFPVALHEKDLDRVHSFQSALSRTMNLDLAFQACWTDADQNQMNWREWLKLMLGLIKNRLILARMGVHKIPLVLSGSLAPVSGEATGECDFDKIKDCEKTAKTSAAPQPARKFALVNNAQVPAGESPETAEITPLAPEPSAEAREHAQQQPQEEEQAAAAAPPQALEIETFMQKSPDAETSYRFDDQEDDDE